MNEPVTKDPGVCGNCGWSLQACHCDEEAEFEPGIDGCTHGIGFDEDCERCLEEIDEDVL